MSSLWEGQQHNISVRGSKNPHAVASYVRDNPKTNVVLCFEFDKQYRYFFPGEQKLLELSI